MEKKVLNFGDFEKFRLNEEDGDSKKSGYADLYLIYLNRIVECYGTFRQCVPLSLPEDVTKRKPALVGIIEDFNDLSNSKTTYKLIKEGSGKEDHLKMWDFFENQCKDLKNKVREFFQIYSTRPEEPKRGETETRSELEDRIGTGAVDAKEAILAANTEASEFVDSAAKIYSGGARNILEKLKDSDLKKINSIIVEIANRTLKGVNINEGDGKGLRKNDKKYVGEYKEVSYLNLANLYNSIYLDILNIRDSYKNQSFYPEIEGEINDYLEKTGVDSAFDFLRKLGSDPRLTQDPENRKEIDRLAGISAKILAREGDLSIYKFKESIEQQVGGKYASNKTLESGDLKLQKAKALIKNLIELAIAKEKAAGRNLDKVIDRLTASAESKKDRVAGEGGKTQGGIDVVSSDGSLTKAGSDKIKNRIKELLGDDDPKIDEFGQGSSTADIAYRLSFFSGNDYRKADGKIDVEKLDKDLDIFTKDVVGNKAYSKFILNF